MMGAMNRPSDWREPMVIMRIAATVTIRESARRSRLAARRNRHSPAFPRTGEPVLVKSLRNAFAGTQLAALIRDRPVRDRHRRFRHAHVREPTARAAGAGVTPAEWVQQATLAALADRFSVVIQDAAAFARGATSMTMQYLP
jgi:hypothetical protein